MSEKAAVFGTTYQNYLGELADIDFLSRAERLGAEVAGEALVIPLYGTPYTISRDGVLNSRGAQANFAISVVLCCYILQCPETVPLAGDWMTYREFRNAGPLVGYFTANTQKIIETAFAGNPAGLVNACQHLGGQPFDDGSSYDISLTFDFLPRSPVLRSCSPNPRKHFWIWNAWPSVEPCWPERSRNLSSVRLSSVCHLTPHDSIVGITLVNHPSGMIWPNKSSAFLTHAVKVFASQTEGYWL